LGKINKKRLLKKKKKGVEKKGSLGKVGRASETLTGRAQKNEAIGDAHA